MNRRLRSLSLAAVAAITLAGVYHLGSARASGIPAIHTLTYSGTLYSNGVPDNASHMITLKLWEKGNAAIACSTIPAGSTPVVKGRFTIPLDSSCVAVIHQSPDVEVEVLIDGTSMGKTPLAAVPYAVEADTASNFAPGSQISQLVPPGTVVPYAGAVGGAVMAPPGWVLCDGAPLSRTQYASLFAAIGTGWGAGDGAMTFNAPDLRGVFLRGVDSGAGKDPDAAGRTAILPGGNTGANVGTAEGDNYASHSHTLNDPGHTHAISPYVAFGGVPSGAGYTAGGAPLNSNNSTALATTGCSVAANGGSETRPKNAAVNYIIKL
jgi:microcystin-dependent protein